MKKLIIFAAALSAAAAFAQTPPAPTPTGARSGDPGEIVCRTARRHIVAAQDSPRVHDPRRMAGPQSGAAQPPQPDVGPAHLRRVLGS